MQTATLQTGAADDRHRTTTPLCVDLDGTLISSDILFELFVKLVRRRPLLLFLIPLCLLRGKAYVKQRIAAVIEFDPALLPYRTDVLAYLRDQRQTGRALVLATAADGHAANRIANHLGIFDTVVASDGRINLSGGRKCERLVTLYGSHGFDYIGNSVTDIPVWRGARSALVVSASRHLRAQVERYVAVDRDFHVTTRNIRPYIKALRIHQWLKNLLVFVPVLAGHRTGDARAAFASLLAFAAFSLCASAVYCINDLFDLDSDRCHPRKKLRPFASGEVPISHGIFLAAVLLFLSSLICVALPVEFSATLLAYFFLTTAYSSFAKGISTLDVFLLACLYTIRIIAGAAATAIQLSFWLLAFSIFLFLSLAMIKRVSELLVMREEGKFKLAGRGYSVTDLETLTNLGSSSGFATVVVLAFYVNEYQVQQLYSHAEMLWLLCPLLLYWIMRLWMGARRGKIDDDPIVFALRDKVSLIIFGLSVLIFLGSI